MLYQSFITLNSAAILTMQHLSSSVYLWYSVLSIKLLSVAFITSFTSLFADVMVADSIQSDQDHSDFTKWEPSSNTLIMPISNIRINP